MSDKPMSQRERARRIERIKELKDELRLLVRSLAKEDEQDRLHGMETENSRTEMIGRKSLPVKIKPY
jgi:hypothetical protein